MSYNLNATAREKKGAKTRKAGMLPAVVYGAGGEAVSLDLALNDFVKMYRQTGESTLIDLFVDDKADGKVLVQEVQYDPVSDRVSHVDLRRIDMKKPMRARVLIHFIGEPPIIKASGGTLVHNIEHVEVECLPSDLVSHIDVDLSIFKSYDTVLKVADLAVPSGMKILSPHAGVLVAKVAEALTEEEIKAMEEAGKTADVSKIEVVEKKKAEEGEEAGAEGEKKDEKAAPAGEKK